MITRWGSSFLKKHWCHLPNPERQKKGLVWRKGERNLLDTNPWDCSGMNTGVVCYFLLQGILLTQGSNLHVLHCTGEFFTAELPGKPTVEVWGSNR